MAGKKTDSNKGNSKRKAKDSNQEELPRKQQKPVTATSEDVDEGLDDFEREDYIEEEEEEDTQVETEQNNNFENSQPKKTSKEAHEAQKAVKIERKLNKPHAELISRCKSLWEKVRNGKIPREEQIKMISDMISILRGQVVELSFKHDASRIVQTCLKYGDQSHRDMIASELATHYLELSKAKYGRFIIVKILKYCKNRRNSIIKEFYGNVKKLIRHAQASAVLEEAYSLYADATERAFLVQEFYGPEFAIFKSGNEKMSLAQILQAHPAKKTSIMKELLQTLSQVMDKLTINHSIVHYALMEYFQNASAPQIQDIIGLLKELIVEFLHTKEGSNVACKCLLYASAKDRKVIVKSFKAFVPKIAKEEYGHVVLLQLFDVVDDTALVEKNITSELVKNANDLIGDKYGRRVIAYLLVGRSQKYISYPTIQMLKEHDVIRSTTSKKDPELRSQELLKFIAQPLLNHISSNLSKLIRDPLPSQIVTDSLLQPEGDKSSVMNSLKSLIQEKSDEEHVLEHIISNRVIKALITFKGDAQLAASYSSIIFEALSAEEIVSRAQSRGSFVILALLESASTGDKVKSVLLSQLKNLTSAVANSNKGLELIVKNLSA